MLGGVLIWASVLGDSVRKGGVGERYQGAMSVPPTHTSQPMSVVVIYPDPSLSGECN